jgi:hypothetical protein
MEKINKKSAAISPAGADAVPPQGVIMGWKK